MFQFLLLLTTLTVVCNGQLLNPLLGSRQYTLTRSGIAIAAPAPIAIARAPVAIASPAPVAIAHPPVAIAHTPVAHAAVEEYDPNPHYSFHYEVNDPLTGDSKSQSESRDGDVVQGTYSLAEPDGSIRTVDYTADPLNGFNAVVHKDAAAHPQVAVAHPPVAVAHAPVAVAHPPVAVAHAPVAVAAPAPVIARAPIVYSRPIAVAAAPAVVHTSFSSPLISYAH